MPRKKKSPWWLLLLPFALAGAGGEKPTPGAPPEPGPEGPTPPPDAPPKPDCLPGTHAVWSASRRFTGWRCVEDAPPEPEILIPVIPTEPPEPPVIPGVIVSPDPGLDDPKIVNPYPTPATFYAVKGGDSEFAVANKYVASVLYIAARDVLGYDHAGALAYASANNTAAARLAAVRFYSCVPDNQRDYGTFAYTPCAFAGAGGGCTFPASNGLGIRFVHTHGNTVERARAGMPWRRAVRVGAPGDDPSGYSAVPQGERAYPLLWLPEPDYDAIVASSGGTWLPSARSWGDGVSRFRPPPAFRALPWEDLTNSGRTEYGCPPNAVEF